MENYNDNIELRSEKVRNFVGKIPPIIIRMGSAIIFLIIIVLLIGSYFLKFDYTIKTRAEVNPEGQEAIVNIWIPANEVDKIKPGQKVVLNLDNIPNLYNQQIVTKLDSIQNKLEVSEEGAYHIAVSRIDILKTESLIEIEIANKIWVSAEINTGKVSFFERAFGKVGF